MQYHILPSLGTRTRQTCSAWSALPIFKSALISTMYFALKANPAFQTSRIFRLLSFSSVPSHSTSRTSALESPRWGATVRHDSRDRAISLRCSLVQALFSCARDTPTSSNNSFRVTRDMVLQEVSTKLTRKVQAASLIIASS